MKWLAAPFRMMLGLHPFWGLTVKSHLLHIGRKTGLYRGPINFVFMAEAPRVGLTGMGVGNGDL